MKIKPGYTYLIADEKFPEEKDIISIEEAENIVVLDVLYTIGSMIDNRTLGEIAKEDGITIVGDFKNKEGLMETKYFNNVKEWRLIERK